MSGAGRASVGIAAGERGADVDELLRRADLAMYAAKNLPGSAFTRYRDQPADQAADQAADQSSAMSA